jgi:predicted  nucleic acid-binding Zn-ribbon protein
MKDAVDLLNERITGLKEELVEKDAEIARLQETLQKIADGIGVDMPTLIKRVDRAWTERQASKSESVKENSDERRG